MHVLGRLGGSWLRNKAPRIVAAGGGAVISASIAGFLAVDKQRLVLPQGKRGKQEVWVWGRRESIPGGADGDLLRPARIKWFESHKPGWQTLAFGPSFGAALDKRGGLFVWGLATVEGEDGSEEVFLGPLEVQVQGDARSYRFSDVQCSSTHIFLRTYRGHTYVIESLSNALSARAQSEGGSISDSPLKLTGRRMPGLPQPGLLNRVWGGGGVAQMGIGYEHACFVTHRGELICTGGNQWGQCGEAPPRSKERKLGAWEEPIRVETALPVRVSFPKSAKRIASVAVGGTHTVATDEAGALFSFGDDRRIQLGLGDTRTGGQDERNSVGVLSRDYLGGKDSKVELKRNVSYKYYDPHMQSAPVESVPPTAVNRPPYPPPTEVVCGQDFTVAIHRDSPDWYSKDEETNVLFCCGENGEGQCGRNRQQQQQTWSQARLPKRSKTLNVSCGQGHCIAQLSNGDLWSWGQNQQGEVGCGSRASTCPPVRLTLDDPSLLEEGEVRRVTGITCGFRNSSVIVEIA